MSADLRRCGRPRGELREMLDGWMHQNPSFTMGQMSRSLGWPLPAANKTLQRALSAGEVRVIDSMRVPEAKRPVAVYARADYMPRATSLGELLRVWS
jgi:hypothetical protein